MCRVIDLLCSLRPFELVRASLNLNITNAYKQTHVIGVDDGEHILRTDVYEGTTRASQKVYLYWRVQVIFGLSFGHAAILWLRFDGFSSMILSVVLVRVF